MGLKNVDRLSSLPEDIQSRILSLMPTKFAVQTCVLSKRWRYTWTSITKLDFDDNPPLGFSNLETFVDRVLGFCKPSQIESLRLNFSVYRVRGSSVSNWIDKAVALNVRELDIQYTFYEFPSRVLPSSVLPSSLFTCTTLTKLKIRPQNIWGYVHVANLPCLKTLDVSVFNSSFASAFKLIVGSPMLENLSLGVALNYGEGDYVFDIPTLKTLKLSFFYSTDTIKLVLRVPKLERLCIDGPGSFSVMGVMEDVSSLVEASFSYDIRLFDNHMVELLKGISGVKLLSLEMSYLLKIISASPLPVFPNMERLELKGYWHYELILEFLKSSPNLKEIYIEKLQGSRWIVPKLVPACMLAKLTTIEFLKFKWRKCDIPFMKFFLRKAKVLKTITINLEKSSVEEETWWVQQLHNVPRASRCCEIHFHRN